MGGKTRLCYASFFEAPTIFALPLTTFFLLFHGTEICSEETQGVEIDKIKQTNMTYGFIFDEFSLSLTSTRSITAITEANRFELSQVWIENACHLYELFFERSSQLISDAKVVENGTLKVVTTSGASLTNDSVIIVLREPDKSHQAQSEQLSITAE